MSGGIIKNIVLAILLLWISFLVGSEAAADVESAGMIIAGIVALFVFIIMGHNCWWLLFILPPVIGLIPLGVIQRLPLQYSISVVIFVYWLAMSLIGRARFTWRSLPWWDYSVYIILIYIAVTYYRHPVAVNYFADENARMVGGKGYVQILSASVYFLIISAIPYNWEQLKRILKWTMWLTVFASVVSAGLILIRGGGVDDGGTIGEAVTESRYGAFLPIGRTAFLLIICLYPLSRILCSPFKIFLSVASLGTVMLSGFRNAIASLAFFSLWTSFVYKKLFLFISISLSAYIALLYASSENMLENLPFGVQRVLSVVPGVEVSKEAERDAAGSTDWRKIMWEWALDPRTGYIRDYVFGDGMGLDKNQMQRWRVSMNRGRTNGGDLEMFADHHMWHSFYIETINTIGIVGLVLLIAFMLETLAVVLLLEIGLRGNSSLPFVMFAFASFVESSFRYFIAVGQAGGIIMGTIGSGALAKVIYIEARKAGVIAPFHWRKRYVPMAVRQLEQSQS